MSNVIEVNFPRCEYHASFDEKIKAMDAVEKASAAVREFCEAETELLKYCHFGEGGITIDTAGKAAEMLHHLYAKRKEIDQMINYIHIKQAELERIHD